MLNVAFAYAGNQAFVTVMCEMRDPSKDFTPAILWLNVIAIPLYVIIGCVVYSFAGQYVVAPAPCHRTTGAPPASAGVERQALGPVPDKS